MRERRTHAERVASRDGYFEPESVIRRVADSPLVPLLGGGGAVLLQVAHPLIAAGVIYHSDYRRDLWHRLLRTMQALYLMVYGSREEGARAGAAVAAVHATVQGRTRERLGPFPPGTPYSASDPALMMWVHATLVQSSLAAYGRFVEPLRPEEAETFYDEMAVVARLFGVEPSVIPASLSEFRAYMRTTLEGPEIRVTAPAREIAAVILEAPLPAPLRLVAPTHRLATSALLPPGIRAAYGLGWNALRSLELALAARSLRMVASPLLRAAAHVSPPSFALAT